MNTDCINSPTASLFELQRDLNLKKWKYYSTMDSIVTNCCLELPYSIDNREFYIKQIILLIESLWSPIQYIETHTKRKVVVTAIAGMTKECSKVINFKLLHCTTRPEF